MKDIIGKLAYGMLFTIVLPILLALWAQGTDQYINLPIPDNFVLFTTLIFGGALLLVLGMLNLWTYGKGLPMNAYPPLHYVSKGAYAFTRHPIYLGSVMLSFGISALFQSDSGFWFVSPLFALMVVVFVQGFEKENILKVFGKNDHKTFLSIADDDSKEPTLKTRIASFVIAFLPWFAMYEAFIFIGTHSDAIPSNHEIDKSVPFVVESVLIYSLIYPWSMAIPFVLKENRHLRQFVFDVITATILGGLMYMLFPFYVEQKPIASEGFFASWLKMERAMDGSVASFPAYHVIWAFIAAKYFSLRYRNLKSVWYVLAILISISCLTTSQHSLIDIVSAVLVFYLVDIRQSIWKKILGISESIANSWKEWRFGSVRVINHGFYAGFSAALGSFIIGIFLGHGNSWMMIPLGLSSIIGAALWAQLIEGSPKLQRPYGYYGAVFGSILTSFVLVIFYDVTFMQLLTAMAFCAPWAQMAGRMRCLVQGCCHGKPGPDFLGIRFNHPLSRVNKVSGLKGACLHPTQLYSIFSNLVCGLIMIRLYQLQMSMSFIAGVYFIMNALSRFVEEHYRGEAQTPYWKGMRVYQWVAVFFILLGAVLTCLPSGPVSAIDVNPFTIYTSIGIGLFSIFAYGIDFPNSNRRFARLAEV